MSTRIARLGLWVGLLGLSACDTPWSLTGDDLLDNPEDALDTNATPFDTSLGGDGSLTVSTSSVECQLAYSPAFVDAEYASDTSIEVHFGGVAAQVCAPLVIEAEQRGGIVVVTHSLVETDAECDDPTPCYYDANIVVSGVSGPGLTVVVTPEPATP